MPGPGDRGRDDDRRLIGDPNSLLLDALERVAVLEAVNRFSELQRQELLATTSKLSGQLGEIALGLRGMSDINARVAALEASRHAHDLRVAKTEGGVLVAKLAWGVIWGLLGAGIAIIGIYAKKG